MPAPFFHGPAQATTRFAVRRRAASLIDSGRYSATYKFATLLAILDLAAETTDPDTGPPDVLHGRDVAARVIELYWPQSAGYAATPDSLKRTLSQSPQNDIPAKLARWRDHHRLGDGATLTDAERADPKGWANLVADLTAIVIGMPLAKLQKFGDGRNAVEDRFIYDFRWAEEVKRPTVERTDSTIAFTFGRVSASGLFGSPRCFGLWSKRNGPSGSQTATPTSSTTNCSTRSSSGAERIDLDRGPRSAARTPGGDCFYCLQRVRQRPEVDHSLPWSRHPDNTLDNLVAAHRACNGAKSASIAGLDHLEHWLAGSKQEGTASPILLIT